MSGPTLYIFAISHFCEKARWSLDYLNVNYNLVHLAPGPHALWAKKHGLSSSTLPILDTDTNAGFIQGSSSIIDWAESVTGSNRSLTPLSTDKNHKACLQIEKRLDELLGVHTRRMFYSEALIDHSSAIRSIFTMDLSISKKLLVSAIWPIARRSMIRSMNLGFEQGIESKKILDGELMWLDDLLADGRRFLVGDSFSRADLTASSLLAHLSTLVSHPSFKAIHLPPRAESTAQEWSQRPSIRWVRKNYAEFR